MIWLLVVNNLWWRIVEWNSYFEGGLHDMVVITDAFKYIKFQQFFCRFSFAWVDSKKVSEQGLCILTRFLKYTVNLGFKVIRLTYVLNVISFAIVFEIIEIIFLWLSQDFQYFYQLVVAAHKCLLLLILTSQRRQRVARVPWKHESLLLYAFFIYTVFVHQIFAILLDEIQ